MKPFDSSTSSPGACISDIDTTCSSTTFFHSTPVTFSNAAAPIFPPCPSIPTHDTSSKVSKTPFVFDLKKIDIVNFTIKSGEVLVHALRTLTLTQRLKCFVIDAFPNTTLSSNIKICSRIVHGH